MTVESLVAHLQRFIDGENISIQWAKDAETLLDQLEDDGVDAALAPILEYLQDNLAIFSPGGGDHLIDEHEMRRVCQRAIINLDKMGFG
jgi:hypothetical protein